MNEFHRVISISIKGQSNNKVLNIEAQFGEIIRKSSLGQNSVVLIKNMYSIVSIEMHFVSDLQKNAQFLAFSHILLHENVQKAAHPGRS